MNDLKNAVPCAASYMLFDPSDEVMKNNLAYYQFHKKQWELTEGDFLPRSVRRLNDYSHVQPKLQQAQFLLLVCVLRNKNGKGNLLNEAFIQPDLLV